MEIANLMENKPSSSIYGVYGNINIKTYHANYSIVKCFRFPKTVADYINSPKALKSLQMVMLDESYLNKTIKDLSLNEIKKINLEINL